MGVSLKDCYDSRPIDFTWSTLRDFTLSVAVSGRAMTPRRQCERESWRVPGSERYVGGAVKA